MIHLMTYTVLDGGFHKWGYPKWMVYNGKSIHGWFGGSPISGNHTKPPYPIHPQIYPTNNTIFVYHRVPYRPLREVLQFINPSRDGYAWTVWLRPDFWSHKAHLPSAQCCSSWQPGSMAAIRCGLDKRPAVFQSTEKPEMTGGSFWDIPNSTGTERFWS